jgi:hypothetical protein
MPIVPRYLKAMSSEAGQRVIRALRRNADGLDRVAVRYDPLGAEAAMGAEVAEEILRLLSQDASPIGAGSRAISSPLAFLLPVASVRTVVGLGSLA